MLTPNDIIGAVNGKLVEKYPDDFIYINLLPKDFERPSFLIELISFNRTDANRTTIEVEASVSVTCYTEIDGHYNSDTEKLATRQSEVMELFAGGYLEVCDRCISVESVMGGVEFTEGYVDLAFDYFDERPMPGVALPDIESVKTNIIKED